MHVCKYIFRKFDADHFRIAYHQNFRFSYVLTHITMTRPRKSSKVLADLSEREEIKTIEVSDEESEDITSSSDEDDDDPVVNTYDVFVSNQLKDHIYLLQYPLRNPDEQYYDHSAPYEARMKAKEGILELDVPVDPNNFSILRGEKFAGHSQGDHSVKQELKVLDRQRLSGKTHTNEASYFVGLMRGSIFNL